VDPGESFVSVAGRVVAPLSTTVFGLRVSLVDDPGVTCQEIYLLESIDFPHIAVAGAEGELPSLSLDLGPVAIGTSETRDLTLANTGDRPLDVTGLRLIGSELIQVTVPDLAAGEDSLLGIARGEPRPMTLACTPAALGPLGATVSFATNAESPPVPGVDIAVTCTGICNEDAQCPASEPPGPWSECAGFSDACDQTGSQTRTFVRHPCVDGECLAIEEQETRECQRVTEGQACGEPSATPWDACGGFEGLCGERGEQRRTLTRFACSAGVCASSAQVETRTCARDTDNTSCGADRVGDWSGCIFGGPCAEGGSERRTIVAFRCADGACREQSREESRGCSRDTDGQRCGDDQTGEWGACSYPGTCAESGSQRRTISHLRCADGACATSSRVETRGCSRDTDGRFCGSDFGTCQRCSCVGGSEHWRGGCRANQRCCEPGICVGPNQVCP
jgi:hypothetical protein